MMLVLVVMGAALVLSSGVALAVTKRCVDKNGKSSEPCYGTKDADTLRGTTIADFIYARGGNDTLIGFSGRDYLYGEGGRDTLIGGRNPDSLNGGRGNDTLDGGDQGDGYGFDGQGWGKDRIIDTPVSSSSEFDDNGVGFGRGPSGGVIINLTSDSGPIPEVKSKSDDSTVDWDGDVIDDVSGSSGDDTINGNGATNHMYAIIANSGNDTISGGGGDDHIDVADESGGDNVECGEGTDTVHRDPPDPATNDPGDVISADCENQLGNPRS